MRKLLKKIFITRIVFEDIRKEIKYDIVDMVYNEIIYKLTVRLDKQMQEHIKNLYDEKDIKYYISYELINIVEEKFNIIQKNIKEDNKAMYEIIDNYTKLITNSLPFKK